MFPDALIKYLDKKNVREFIQLTIPGYSQLCQSMEQGLEETGPATPIVSNRKDPILFLYFYKIQNLLPREWCHPEWEKSSHFINMVKIMPTPDMFRGIALK